MEITELENSLATRSGFAARVVAPAGMRNVGYFIWILALLAAVGTLLEGDGVGAAGLAMGVCFVPGLVVVLLGLLKERLSLRPLHARYLDRGWVSVQVPCGLVHDTSGDGTVVRRDRALVKGLLDDATPVVLVGGPGQSAEAVEAAAAQARDALAQMSEDAAWGLAQRVWSEGLGRDHDAATFFPVPAGLMLTVRQGLSPFVLVVPAADRPGGARIRYYPMRTPRRGRRSTSGRGQAPSTRSR